MTDPRPTDQLIAEHERILVLLEVLTQLAEAAEADSSAAGLEDDIEAAVNATRLYADMLHHGKEEALLFPALEQHGIPREGGPIGCMLHEHEEGRGYVDDMESGLKDMRGGSTEAGVKAFAEAVASFVPLLRQHIQKENQVLFPMAEQVLDPDKKAELLEAFAGVEAEDVGRQEVERLRGVIDGLAARWLKEAVS